jgi:hypothetical protein
MALIDALAPCRYWLNLLGQKAREATNFGLEPLSMYLLNMVQGICTGTRCCAYILYIHQHIRNREIHVTFVEGGWRLPYFQSKRSTVEEGGLSTSRACAK